VRTRAGVIGAVLRTAATRAEERALHERSQALLDYVGIARHRHELAHILPTAISAGWRSHGRWRPHPSCSRSTSRLPA
jgi:hypothetical protein